MSEEQAQQLLYQMQVLESYASSLDQKEQAILSILREAMSSIESIRGIIQNPSAESLIPMGLGTYVKANLQAGTKKLLDVGAGIVVEKDNESAINYLESKIKEFQVALNETGAQKHDALNRLDQLKQEMDYMIQASKKSSQ